MKSLFIFISVFTALFFAEMRPSFAKKCGEDYQSIVTQVEQEQRFEAEKILNKKIKKCEEHAIYPFLLARLMQKHHFPNRDVHDVYMQSWLTYKNHMDVTQQVKIPEILGPLALLELQMGDYHIAVDRFKTLEKFRSNFKNFDYYQALAYQGAGRDKQAKKSFENCLSHKDNQTKAPICFQNLYPAALHFDKALYTEKLKSISTDKAAIQYYQNIFLPRLQRNYPRHLQNCRMDVQGSKNTKVEAVVKLRRMGGVEAVYFNGEDGLFSCLGEIIQFDVFKILPPSLSEVYYNIEIQVDGGEN